MHIKTSRTPTRLAPARAGYTLAGLLPFIACVPAEAVEFSFLDDEVHGSLDTTVSYGQLWRVQGRDKSNDDINANDGNRNFDPGLVSSVYKITSELETSYRNYGLFLRASGFYDSRIMNEHTDYNHNNTPAQPSQSSPDNRHFTRATRRNAGSDVQILDAYVRGDWELAGKPVAGRLGRQVFNWGEGLFYRGGVNTTNPIDAAQFRLPGAELKEVLMPVEALNVSVGLTDNLSMESFYQFNWKETAIDPVGTYFAETDLFAKGGHSAYATVPQLRAVSALHQGLSALGVGGLQGGPGLDGNGNLKVASIGPDINARDDGQFGVAFRYNAEQLNNTEFGFYFVNYHSKEPTVHADLGAYKGLNMAQIKGAAAPGVQQQVAQAMGISVAQLQAAIAANPTGQAARAYQATLQSAADGVAALDVANQVRGRREYAEDIRMFGVSFNTRVGEAALFGELAYRPNMPIGIGTTGDLLDDLLTQAGKLANGEVVNIGGQYVRLGDEVKSSERVQMFNASLGTLYNFGPRLGFDGVTAVAEVASEHLRGSSLQYTAFDGTRRYYSSRANAAYAVGFGDDAQITRDAYGATLMLMGTWNNVLGGMNVTPFVTYKDDFRGNSHQTGNFIEGRKAYSVGVKASYQNRLEGELQYTEFYGAGQKNATRDRDNLGFNVKYSF
ncbi:MULTISPECIES: DUF1302 domain-containing protein [Pseudomonas]|uniref:DUF1302 domain-containing protein n=1 Tax=Pseudomonas eucalypticola TaxID=2599595 RepID=A0A7D5HVI1_9PSED|nr:MULTISPECIES: DUF1302 domain-containing protein [Pseudomonas]QKZ03691.1 DUF1302 domain-containing protein [Pseudomonas eucalypticola]